MGHRSWVPYALWTVVAAYGVACSSSGESPSAGSAGGAGGTGGTGGTGGSSEGGEDDGSGGSNPVTAGTNSGGKGGAGGGPSCAGCTIDAACVAPGRRNPENPCQACNPDASSSSYSPIVGSCDDGAYCTVDDSCSDGVCSGQPRACSDDISCNGAESCDETAAACVPGVGECGQGLLCDAETDQCVQDCDGCVVAGTCYALNATDPNNPCRICDPARSSVDWSDNDGATCDDESFCTEDDSCLGGSCGGTMLDCDDGIACNGEESCDEIIDDCAEGVSPCSGSEVCNLEIDMCEALPECGNSSLEDGEACDDGVNDGQYGGCMPGCQALAPRCGDGMVQAGEGELCDGNCPMSCTPSNDCDTATLSGSAANCNAQCTHQATTMCADGDGCCPNACLPFQDDDCEVPVYDVDICVDNQNNVTVVPSMLNIPYESYARIRWHNVCAYTVQVINFGWGTTWAQLDVLSPGESTTASSTAEGPWCAWEFAGMYRLGGLHDSGETGFLIVDCI